MKKFSVMFFAFCLACLSEDIALTVFDAGKSCSIIISPSSSETERFAAQELADYLGKITGGKFAVTADLNTATPRILVGASLFPAEASILGYDSFRIKVAGQEAQLFGASSKSRGNLYAVYELLEQLGCRFYTHDVEKIPSKSQIVLPDCDETQKPAFPEVRMILSMHGSGWFHEWDSKMKLNGVGWNNDVPEKFGVGIQYRPYPYHTMGFLIPPEKYFDEHPEYFALIDGTPNRQAYCLRNSGLIQATIASLKAHLQKRYVPGLDMGINLPDNGYHCACDACKGSDAYEGSPVANNIYFTNKVASALRKEYPDLTFHTDAYQYTRTPPKYMETAPGVYMCLANLEGDFAGDLDSEKNNKRFKAEIVAWKNHSEKLHYLDYGAYFSGLFLPLPNLEALPRRYAQLHELGITGIHTINQAYQGNEFYLLRNYVTAKLMWNPKQDVWALAADFCDGYYGAAGPILCEYLRYYHSLAKAKGTVVYYETPWPDFLDDAFIAKAKEYFQRARAAVAGNQKLTERVEVAELSARYSELFLNQTKIGNSPELLKAAKEFKMLCQKYNVKHKGENAPMQDFENVIPPPDFCKNLKHDEWVTFRSEWWGMNHQVFREKDPVTQREALRMVTNHVEWSLYKPMGFLNLHKRTAWDVYAYVRVVPGPKAKDDSIAFQMGVMIDKDTIPRGTTTLEETSGTEYRYIKVGENIMPLEKSSAWLAPKNNPDEVAAIWIDHWLFVEHGKAVAENSPMPE